MSEGSPARRSRKRESAVAWLEAYEDDQAVRWKRRDRAARHWQREQHQPQGEYRFGAKSMWAKCEQNIFTRPQALPSSTPGQGFERVYVGAPGGTRTPNLFLRTELLFH